MSFQFIRARTRVISRVVSVECTISKVQLTSGTANAAQTATFTFLRVTHGFTLKNVLVHHKDREDKEQTTECVYKVPCASCEKTYIGETGR